MRRTGRAWCLVATLVCAACGVPPLLKLPDGPGSPAPDAADALGQATRACRNVRTLTAEIAVSGSAARHPIRGRLLVGIAAPSSARLEALAPFGPPVFILVATGSDATLLLPRDERVLEHGRPDAVLEAVAGVPLDAADLRDTLTGCPVPPAPLQGRVRGEKIGDWRIVTSADGEGEDVASYLKPDTAGAWRVMTIMHGSDANGWRADYGDFHNGLPRSVRIAADDTKRFDLRLVLSQVEINVPLGPGVFRVEIPRAAQPISLEELQRSGPFAASAPNAR